ncbi:MAG TPA: DUF2235 domain-containing protein [Marmoricola sp.]|jgi:hypothetical protein|nr:DUF2235 domain-containing protein [Marmoricola sp.]
MKRLVVCCDGTWNKADSVDVTNIEKIALTVQSNPGMTGDVQQLVYYVSGVGTGGYEADKLLGGGFGFGLLHNMIECYRFLALNYEPDDEIFLFGFSRGAYTARSLGGMIADIGLLTRNALVEGRLRDAVFLYRRVDPPEGAIGESVDEFRHDHCHAAPVRFLGVFDTVGALGVPGIAKAPQFHDVQLSGRVKVARHAMAIDEKRLKFAPTLWEAPAHAKAPEAEGPDVKQVWFEGVHSDVGGGYAQTGLSDTALLWMVREAHSAGLVFDVPLLGLYVNSGSDPIRHDSLSTLYKADNVILAAKQKLGIGAPDDTFEGGLRRLSNPRALSIRVASSVVANYEAGSYSPANLVALAEATHGFTGIIEPVIALPEAGTDLSALGRPPDTDPPA